MNVKLSWRMWKRNYSSKHVLNAKTIRTRYLEFFINENGHQLVNSSPVASYFDPSIPFINAGMCQFKRVFTGEEKIPYKKVANTQKCIRVGGKHNDLNLVGIDSYHHTFFEMLGNWSFGAYSKKEACKLAWELLTSAPFNLTPNRLFVTYFQGNEKLNLPPDEDVKNIWLELGVSPSRILPFGMKENFWEMDLIGPCGTSTEIHVALTEELYSKSELINKNNPLLSELWNIVFIKYNKTGNSIGNLPEEYIDTGMGLERLITVLQNKKSNYDTDLFFPLFNKISQLTGAPSYEGSFEAENLDMSYRCLADFSRMITVSIADNIFPDINPKLRRILRKALYIAKYDFEYKSPEKLIEELSKQIAEQLYDVFPEIGNSLSQVNQVVHHENELVEKMIQNYKVVWNIAKSNNPILQSFSFVEYPGLPEAFKYLKSKLRSNQDNILHGELVHYLYDTYGLDKPVVEKLTQKMNLKVNWDEVENCLMKVKERTRNISKHGKDFAQQLNSLGIKCDDFQKFSYRKNYNKTVNDENFYEFPDVNAKLLAILNKDKIISIIKCQKHNSINEELKSKVESLVHVTAQKEVGLVFDKTNFFSAGGGQFNDTGTIIIINDDTNIEFIVTKVRKIEGIIVHFCYMSNVDEVYQIKAGTKATLKVDGRKKLSIMRNHSISHLLTSVVKDLYPLSYFKQGTVDDKRSSNTYRVLGKSFDRKGDKAFIEKTLKKYIEKKLTIDKMILQSGLELLKLPSCTLSPGEIYPPHNIQVISVINEKGKVISREACGSVHLSNTGDIDKFYVSEMKITPSSDLFIEIITGAELTEEENMIIYNTEKLENTTLDILNNENITLSEHVDLITELSTYVYKIGYEYSVNGKFKSFCIKNCFGLLMDLQKKLNEQLRRFPRENIVRELSKRIKQKINGEKFVVYFCLLQYSDYRHDSFKIDIIYRHELPTILFNYSNWKLNGVCHVPKSLITEDFNSEIWMKSTLLEHNLSIKMEDDMKNYCFVQEKNINPLKIYFYMDSLLRNSIKVAQEKIK